MAYMKTSAPLEKKKMKKTATPRQATTVATVTKTNRTTGAKTTTNKRLTTSSAEEFNSNGKMMKTATPKKTKGTGKQKTSGVRFKAYNYK